MNEAIKLLKGGWKKLIIQILQRAKQQGASFILHRLSQDLYYILALSS